MKYTARASTNLIINFKGNATVTASIDGYNGITNEVSINAELQQYKNGRWTKVTAIYNGEKETKTIIISEPNY